MRNLLVALLVLLVAGLPVVPGLADALAGHASGLPVVAATQAADAVAPRDRAPAGVVAVVRDAMPPTNSAIQCCVKAEAPSKVRTGHCGFDLVYLVSATGTAFVSNSGVWAPDADRILASLQAEAPFRPPILS